MYEINMKSDVDNQAGFCKITFFFCKITFFFVR